MHLVLTCARPDADPSAVRTAAAEVADWNSAVAFASTHRLAPLVFWRLREFAEDLVPPAVFAALGRTFHATVRSNLFLAAELARASGWLDAAGVAALTFKGPALTALLYPNLGLRPSSDIDLLVPARQRDSAVAALCGHGCRPLAAGAERFRGAFEATFISPAGCNLDLHWSASPPYFLAFDSTHVWHRSQAVQVAGVPVRTFGPEDLFACLALHGAKHCWESLGWIADIAYFVANIELDWDELLRDPRRRRAITLAVFLASDLFGTAVPAAVAPDETAARLAREIRELVLASATEVNATVRGVRIHLQIANTWRDRLRYLVLRGLEPNQKDNEFVRLPPALRPAFFAIRPIRLALVCATDLARRDFSGVARLGGRPSTRAGLQSGQ